MPTCFRVRSSASRRRGAMMPARPTIRPPERLLDRYWRVACGAVVAQAKGQPVTEEAKRLARRALGKPANTEPPSRSSRRPLDCAGRWPRATSLSCKEV
jgi:hypothetical protein